MSPSRPAWSSSVAVRCGPVSAANTGGAPWVTCEAEGCTGARLDGAPRCVAHLDEDGLIQWLARVDAGAPVDARGVVFSKDLLARVLDGRTQFSGARFDGATFERDAPFDKITFDGTTSFDEATFTRKAGFGSCRFTGAATFAGTTFVGHLWFVGTTCDAPATFDKATFSGPAWFTQAVFNDGASFAGVQFGGLADFSKATFGGDATFATTTFAHDLGVDRAHFDRAPSFTGASFRDKRPLPAFDSGTSALTWPSSQPRVARAGGRAVAMVRRVWIPLLILLVIALGALLFRGGGV
ncbi:MAG: pentapeptide repeat-containing protein, partial [Actinomycetota bacterium]|nr:pentapeptide repeat-containing protein [Actinomycetota bacterium]